MAFTLEWFLRLNATKTISKINKPSISVEVKHLVSVLVSKVIFSFFFWYFVVFELWFTQCHRQYQVFVCILCFAIISTRNSGSCPCENFYQQWTIPIPLAVCPSAYWSRIPSADILSKRDCIRLSTTIVVSVSLMTTLYQIFCYQIRILFCSVLNFHTLFPLLTLSHSLFLILFHSFSLSRFLTLSLSLSLSHTIFSSSL